ncbi:TIGR03943 family protein [Curtobacterium pusillum]|uniref:Repeat protein (TIGR03943 family) n=1 Tax=Curtobacterium pusillum TaxID=69373 RepID=A0AAW3T547_9MICO|nr:TIGR03943 family protein [Curtobacterium pusillum]MBA8989663.1 putative repeat protein (TIGR03943 family) [Curtobacterium pusillum]NUU14846.1 TIGR03943 family protein [Curtobacterium pusillum]GLK32407.1 TIGR03943 family protein [Curtobacterium pusillum]
MSSSEPRLPSYLGLGSVLGVALCTLWLAVAGHLDLYINPRYSVFTVVLAAVAVPASVAGLVVVARGHGHAHGDEGHDERTGGAARLTRIALGGVAALVTIGVTAAMLVLPPTTLSARTAQQRSVDSATLSDAAGSEAAVSLLGSGSVDTSEYGVKDWAALIRQTTDTTSLVGKKVELSGFVVPGSDGSFTLTRFVISCCAVDAQPVGLAVVTDGGVPDEDQWVTVSGALAANPDQSADARIVIRAAKVTKIAQPKDPYEY